MPFWMQFIDRRLANRPT